MSFTEGYFILFLLSLLILYYLFPKRMQWVLLLVGSWGFYAFAGWKCLLFLGYTTAVAYVISCLMARNLKRESDYMEANRELLEKEARKAYRAKAKKQRRHILVMGLILGFGLLAVFKYTAFVVTNVNGFLSLFGDKTLKVPSLLLPMGLSFYVFQTMGYLIDVYRGKVQAERNPFRVALFVSFFPQLVQGPISRYGDLAEQLFLPHRADPERLTAGLCRVTYGYFKKMVVADTAFLAIRTILEDPDRYAGMYVVVLILLYSIEIYGDFTGGIDIALGVAEMFGIRLKENFDRPFSSRSVKEYWRRWHITMGTWFTDYVFYPLSVSRPMQKLSKFSRSRLGTALGKRIPVYLATIVTWFLTGLWHGAGWNFIVWGLLNCLVILISQELEPLYRRFHNRFPRLGETRFYHGFCAVRTFLLMGLIRSLDCYRDVPRTFRLWGSILTRTDTWRELLTGGLLKLGLDGFDFAVLGISILVLFAVSKAGKQIPLRERLAHRPVLCCACIGGLIVAILLFGSYGIGYDASQFIYGQF